MSACPLFSDNICRAANDSCATVSKEACNLAKRAFQLGKSSQIKDVSLYARCFGYFELFFNGQPLHFGRKQTKELIAYLIDRRGSSCTADEIACALWEYSLDAEKMKHRVRNLIADLRAVLRSVNMEHLIIRGRETIAIKHGEIVCDYYDYLSGIRNSDATFRGEYMEQYSWSESTKAALTFGDMLV